MEEDPFSTSEGLPSPSRPWWRRRGVLIAAGVLVTAASVAVGVFLIGTPDTVRTPERPQTTVAAKPALDPGPVVAATRGSVLKVLGDDTPGCVAGTGTGFVVAPKRVMVPAGTVAGLKTVGVDDGQTKYPAHVISYDPNVGIAILEVRDLPAVPLEFDTQEASPETEALVLGFPDGEELTTTTVRIHETIELNGPNLYGTDTVNRQVYTLKGAVSQGGPLVSRDGRVLGVVFGVARDSSDIDGFALTAQQVTGQMSHIGDGESVSTGECPD